MSVLLKIERLILRRITLADAADMAAMNADPKVMRYVGDGKPRSPEQSLTGIRRALRIYDTYPGLGVFVAEEKRTRKFAGVFHLVYVIKTVEVEIGYRLPQSAWGKGYATEGAAALLRYGFETVGLDRIIGLTYPANKPSQRVLEKIGMKYQGMGHYFDLDLRYYVAERADFEEPEPRKAE